ncbi:MAG: hypothetical protein WBC13_02815 [Dokdonella sp.]|jgi:hypothetical protein
MQTQRVFEANIFGYRLDRINEDSPRPGHYEVSTSDGKRPLASFADRRSAEEFILRSELSTHQIGPRTPAY